MNANTTQLQCRLFNQTYNPNHLHTGNRILRERLIGPALASYYPPRAVTHRTFRKLFPRLEGADPHEIDRVEGLTILKSKGKGAPKKRRTKEEGKKGRRR